MTPTLGARELAQMQQAFSALQSGHPMRAEQMVRAMGQVARQHPDALFIFASARRALGDMAAARAGYEAALRGAPGNPQLWNAYGNHLHDMGQAAAGVEALQRAVGLQPAYAEGWMNLAIVATDAGAFEIADHALQQAARHAPGEGRLSGIRGALEQARGRPEAAAAAYRQALQHDPADTRARHNLAAALRMADRRDEALAIVEAALFDGMQAPQSLTLRAHLLAELGRFDDAVTQYRDVLERFPDFLDAHDTYARLLPQIGRSNEALTGYDRALARNPTPGPLLLSAIRTALDLRRPDKALQWIDLAQEAHRDTERLSLMQTQALDMAGRRDEAIDIARMVVNHGSASPAAHVQLAHLLLTSGDIARAEHHAELATRKAPFEQKAWALLSVIWRLMNDEREFWLAGYENIVTMRDIGTPAGWSHQKDFLDDLQTTLSALHVTTAHPADQTLRGGTQTRGNLFDRRSHPVIVALEQQLQSCVEAMLAELPDDDNHPFLSRRTDHIRFAGAWSVRLRPNGHHVQHFHPQGWLSSAFYVALPELSGPQPDADAGALLLGIPDAALGLPHLTSRRILKPAAGQLALFPSYVWHGTAPFHGNQPRLTVAFDALPG